MEYSGYYTHPTVFEDRVVFVSEEDLWMVSLAGGRAERLTSGRGSCKFPCFSPDGKQIAFLSSEEGDWQVYVINSLGGRAKRLTYIDSEIFGLNWTSQGLFLASTHERPFRKDTRFYRFNFETLGLEEMPWGHGSDFDLDRGDTQGVVVNRLGFNTLDTELAYWKRYRGGTAGDLWIDPKGSGEFQKLIELDGNLGRPLWIGERIFFLSDHENIANIYSCNLQGGDLQKVTNQSEFFVRNPKTDGKNIVFHSGGDLFSHNISTAMTSKLDIHFPSPRTQLNRTIESASKNLEVFCVDDKTDTVAFSSRGQVFCLPMWHGSILRVPNVKGHRYRYPFFIEKSNRLGCIVDNEGEELIHIQAVEDAGFEKNIKGNYGRIVEIESVPNRNAAIFTNHRNQISLIDFDSEVVETLDTNPYQRVGSFHISPDGRWLAYSKHITPDSSSLFIMDLETRNAHQVTSELGQDMDPFFCPEGKYLYFISYREFNPVYDALHFELGFPRGGRPYVVTLRADVSSPFSEAYLELRAKEKEESDKEEQEDQSSSVEGDSVSAENSKGSDKSLDSSSDKDKDQDTVAVKIDFDGILERQIAFPVSDGKYFGICATKDRVFFGLSPVKGSLEDDFDDEKTSDNWLETYDLKNQKEESWGEEIEGFELTNGGKYLVIYKDQQVRITKPGEKPEEKSEGPGPQSGLFDFRRVSLEIDPQTEWRQILREAWRLQRDHFWDENMGSVDWDQVYQKYLPVVERLSCRRELNDLLWEMQGELGASHAYASGGALRAGPYFHQAYLGADIKFDQTAKKYKIHDIYKGSSWDEKEFSPLSQAGVHIDNGDFIVEINGRKVDLDNPLEEELSTLGAKSFRIGVQTKDEEIRYYTIRGLYSEKPLLYRQWVNRNRKYVHEKTGGKVGYIHIPDMGPRGYSEFHKFFLTELYKEGLVIDVRFNGGGHVSGLLLEKLARKRIAYCQTRWSGVFPYPDASPDGPMVAITNEYAGSDGDIFSHSFKFMELGPLIGKRTWGGVIGIWPPYDLLDGGRTTQPEFAFWFKDVGWKVENFGTEPNIEVENRPESEAKGQDEQLDRAIAEILRLHQASPPKKPEFKG